MKGKKLGLTFITLYVIGKLLGLGGAEAKASENWGYIQNRANVEGKGSNNSSYITKDNEVHPDTTNWFDQNKDQELAPDFIDPNESGAYVDIENRKIISEFSPEDSNYPKYIHYFFKGPITQGEDPNVTLEFRLLYGGDFGGRRLILTEMYNDLNNQDPNNSQVELQQKIAESGDGIVRIVYGKLPEGNYEHTSPFLCLRLDFDKLLADLDGNNEVNFKDYAILVGKERDISGPNDLPDMIFDTYDIAKFVEYWLETAPEPISKLMYDKIHRKIDPILMNHKINNDFYQQQREKFFAKYGPKEDLEAKLDKPTEKKVA